MPKAGTIAGGSGPKLPGARRKDTVLAALGNPDRGTDVVALVVGLMEQGVTPAQIAEQVGIPVSRVNEILGQAVRGQGIVRGQ